MSRNKRAAVSDADDQGSAPGEVVRASKAPPPIEHLPDRPLVVERNYQFQRPDWTRWDKFDRAFLWEAACLAADIEPPRPGRKGIYCLVQLTVFPEAFHKVWEAVNRDSFILATVNPQPNTGRMMYAVRIDEFADWATRKGFAMPVPMQKRAARYAATRTDQAGQRDDTGESTVAPSGKLSKVQRAEIVRRNGDGESAKALAEEFGKSLSYIYRLVREAGEGKKNDPFGRNIRRVQRRHN